MPSTTAVSKAARRATDAHQAQKYTGERGALGFSRMRGSAEFGKPKSERIAQHNQDQRDEPGLGERSQQGGTAARFDAPLAQRGRGQEEKHADERASCGEPHCDSR